MPAALRNFLVGLSEPTDAALRILTGLLFLIFATKGPGRWMVWPRGAAA